MKIAKITFFRCPVGRKFRRNRSISHGLGDMSTFAFFSTQNSQLLIYLINYSLIYEAIPPKSNPIQAINPMNLHTKFQKARLNSLIAFVNSKCLETKEILKSSKVANYSVSYRAIITKSNPIQAINPTRGMLLLTKAKCPLKFKMLCGFNKHAVKLRMHKAAPYAFPIPLNTF